LWIRKFNKHGLVNLSIGDVSSTLNESLEKYHKEKREILKTQGIAIRTV
jgi:hypothetical protein